MNTKSRQLIIIAIGVIVLYFLLKKEAQAGETTNILPSSVPRNPISHQIVTNIAFDH